VGNCFELVVELNRKQPRLETTTRKKEERREGREARNRERENRDGGVLGEDSKEFL